VFALVEEYYDAVSVVARDSRAKLLTSDKHESGVGLPTARPSLSLHLYHPLTDMGSAGEVKRLYVRPAFRRKRIAQTLLDNWSGSR